jgi:hypothetical protein
LTGETRDFSGNASTLCRALYVVISASSTRGAQKSFFLRSGSSPGRPTIPDKA